MVTSLVIQEVIPKWIRMKEWRRDRNRSLRLIGHYPNHWLLGTDDVLEPQRKVPLVGFSTNPVVFVISSTHLGQRHVFCFTRKEAEA